ncbi:hypothetical protein ABLA30_00755 [Xenorhabdus nematophila]|uniref:hypothetical protein n=1 Tax=Xenorhabdus nematophila TaxID=628 RepID=UPI0032B83373
MRNIQGWAASEHTKLFNTLKEPFFVEKIARYTGRSVNEILEKLIQVGLCTHNVKSKTVLASQYTSVAYFTSSGWTTFISTLELLGWVSVMLNGEEKLKAPDWWLKNDDFPHEIVGTLEKNKTVWINEEIQSVIGMLKNTESLSDVADTFNRDVSDVKSMLVDLGGFCRINREIASEIILSDFYAVS